MFFHVSRGAWFEVVHSKKTTLVETACTFYMLHGNMQAEFLQNMKNSGSMHGKILENFKALCKKLKKYIIKKVSKPSLTRYYVLFLYEQAQNSHEAKSINLLVRISFNCHC